MEQELNITAILRDKPKRTKLWSPIIGNCKLMEVSTDGLTQQHIIVYNEVDSASFTDEGKFSPNGECLLFPSKEMQDWSKFAWKKGDVLVDNKGYTCLFCKWKDDAYTSFIGKYTHFEDLHNRSIKLSTDNFHKIISNEKIDEIIKEVEAYYNGKLNLETLEIERPKPQFKDGDIIAMDIQGSTDIAILKGIYTEDIVFYAVLCNGKDLLLDEPSKLNVVTLRLATDSEKQQLFDALAKESKRWNAETKTLEDLPKKCELKPFDKVLVRDDPEDRWRANLFSHYRDNDASSEYPYRCISDMWKQCIPYNEQTKHLLGTTDNYEEG